MNVPSSISSSNRRLPRFRWKDVLVGGLMTLVIFICFMEIGLALRGIQPSLVDSSRTWQKQRERADELGARALVLVGSSRIMLDMDIATLRQQTGLEPVQLAIEGSSFIPVLAGLAIDPEFRGSVIVDVYMSTIATPPSYDAAYSYQQDYEHNSANKLTGYQSIEAYLGDQVHFRLRSYADGARPLSSFLKRILRKPDPIQYLKTLPDREVLADYRRAPMPYLYYFRALRNLDGSTDLPSGLSYREIGTRIEAGIAALQPVDDAHFLSTLPAVDDMVRSIKAKGGQVYLVEFPKGGYVKETDDRRYPRSMFWDRFAAGMDAPTLNFEDVPALRSFICPDGSHLDYHDRPRFTAALVDSLGLGRNHGSH
jgi:hypothetical protein